jgi:hypothetical protein
MTLMHDTLSQSTKTNVSLSILVVRNKSGIKSNRRNCRSDIVTWYCKIMMNHCESKRKTQCWNFSGNTTNYLEETKKTFKDFG